jgi:hypothetical protein
MHMRAIRVFGLLSLLLTVATNALAVGPGLREFEEGKGTIGLICTNPQGRQFAMPTWTTPPSRREAARTDFNNCMRQVGQQWTEEALASYADMVDRRHRPIPVWNYIDGATEYRNEMSSMQSAVISRRRSR